MNKKLILLATVSLCLIPCVGVGALTGGLAMMVAQVPSPITGTADQLVGKSLAYWLLTLAGIAIASWTWIFKWLINQLELQRQAHAETTKQLIEFMRQDHTATATMLASTQATLATAQAALATLAHSTKPAA